MQTSHQFYESQIHFVFNESWNVVAFDKTKFYKTISGLGVKGVDFLGIYKEELFFIEVKNFRQYHPIPSSSFDFEQFTSKIIIKFEDSQRAIRLIHKHYHRKIWYKIFIKWQSSFPNLFGTEFKFWEQCYHLMTQTPSKNKLVLWMEHDFDQDIVLNKIIEPITDYFSEKSIDFLFVNASDNVLPDLRTLET